jgi:hypothetical protein
VTVGTTTLGGGAAAGYGSPVRALLTALTACALMVLPHAPATAADVTWTRVGTGLTGGVSGVAAQPGGGWVVVRDNKTAGQNRVALMTAAGAVTPLTWPGTAPQDLEAIDSVPGKPGQYAVVTSAGSGRVISVTGTTLKVVGSFTLPTGRVENEAFALTRLGTKTVAVWGNRGSAGTPGRLFTAAFNVAQGTFAAVDQGTVQVPYPTTDVRHISDAEVLGGRIVVASASDAGNDGPFASALYDVGTVRLVSGRPRLSLVPPASLATYADHKIEAISCSGASGDSGVSGVSGVLGTDDENLGGWVAPASFCPSTVPG